MLCQKGFFFACLWCTKPRKSTHRASSEPRFNSLPHNLDFWLPNQRSLLETLWEKGENAGYQHFLLFPQCLFTLHKTNFKISFRFILSSAHVLNLDQSKILSFGKEYHLTLHALPFKKLTSNLSFNRNIYMVWKYPNSKSKHH